MHRSTPQLFSLLLLAGALASCDAFAIRGSGIIDTIEPELEAPKSIETVEIGSGLDARISRGDTPLISITGDDNLLQELVIRERGYGLYIALPDSAGGYRPTRPIRVEITLPELQRIVESDGSDLTLKGGFEDTRLEIEMSGGGSLKAASLHGRDLDLKASGGGEIELRDLQLESLRLDVSGGGLSLLEGQVDTLEAHLEGGGKLEAFECEARAVSLEAEGGAEVSVYATSVLDVEASGGGVVTYRGDPETLHSDLSGGAVLQRD